MSKLVMHALIAKKKIGFMDGTIEEPSLQIRPNLNSGTNATV